MTADLTIWLGMFEVVKVGSFQTNTAVKPKLFNGMLGFVHLFNGMLGFVQYSLWICSHEEYSHPFDFCCWLLHHCRLRSQACEVFWGNFPFTLNLQLVFVCFCFLFFCFKYIHKIKIHRPFVDVLIICLCNFYYDFVWLPIFALLTALVNWLMK